MKLSLPRLAALGAGLVVVLVLGLRHRGALESIPVPAPVTQKAGAPPPPAAAAPQAATPLPKGPLPVALRNGKSRDLSVPPGKLLVVHFWATWCAPCVEELPGLVAWWKEAKSDPRVELVAVSVDRDWKTVESFVEQAGAKGVPLALDPKSTTANAFGTTKFPETYVISADGRILHREEGPLDWRSPFVRKMLDDFRGGVPSPKAAVRDDSQPGKPS